MRSTVRWTRLGLNFQRNRLLAWAACFLLFMVPGCARQSADSDASAEARIGLDVTGSAEFSREGYDAIVENGFVNALQQPLSTFSIDVDTASYANLRRMLQNGKLPPSGAVRIEELINYFPYADAPPDNEHPFAVHVAAARCPWQDQHQLVRIALKGRELDVENRPTSNLVFLLDVSGSMNAPNKLPLVKNALRLLLGQLTDHDRISIVVYAGASGLVLPATPASEISVISDALESLSAGGSTNGGEGIELAYRIATENFIDDGINRVILCTDGDFNVGTTSRSDLIDLITAESKTGVFLSVFGFGQGNLQDSTMEQLADKGNGTYGYIDSLFEAKKNLVEQLGGTLMTIAKDVKIQVDFNPSKVSSYRLIGYENRMLATEDFKDDTKDAGEIGAGHTVSALYEITQTSNGNRPPNVDASEYVRASPSNSSDDLLTVRLRYKLPDSSESTEFRVSLSSVPVDFDFASSDFQFAAAVAAYGMLLRKSAHAGSATFGWAAQTAARTCGTDRHGYRHEFVRLAELAASLAAAQR